MSESEFVQHIPCDNCGSSDANALYDDGHTHCFSCDKTVGGKGVDGSSTTRDWDPLEGTHPGIPSRSISADTMRFAGYAIGKDDYGRTVHIANIRDAAGTLVAQKLRGKDKAFSVRGAIKDKPLYLMHKWTGGKKLVITEGEIDALSVLEAQQCKWPVVSLPNGAQGAKKTLLANIDWLNRFDELILMFDMDEPGQQAVEECLPLFEPGKVKRAELPHKDANACLVAGEAKAIIDAIWNAQEYKPSGVVSVEDVYDDAIAMPKLGLSFPWESLTAATYGLRPGEIYMIGAAPKIGKTQWQRELVSWLIKEHGQTIGMFSLEEPASKSVRNIACSFAKKDFTKPGGDWTQDELKAAVDQLKGHLMLYDSWGSRDPDEILATMRFFAAHGITYMILDPLTAIVSEYDTSEANSVLNSFMGKLAALCLELQITVFCFSHVNPVKSGMPHDEGGRVLSSQFTGSRAQERWSYYGIGLSRNRVSDDPDVRNTTTMEMLFDRMYGEYLKTELWFDRDTGDYREKTQFDGEQTFQEEETESDF